MLWNFFTKSTAVHRKYGEVLALSVHSMAVYNRGIIFFCLFLRKDGWVELYRISENTLVRLDKHTIGYWEDELKTYGLPVKGWQLAEETLPNIIIQTLKVN